MLTIGPIRFACVPIALLIAAMAGTGWAQLPDPVLETVFPPGGQAGASVELVVDGSQLQGIMSLTCGHPGITFKHLEKNRFRADVASSVVPGLYDLRCIGPNGLSSSRLFFVSNRDELLETEPNDALGMDQQPVAPGSIINGRIDKGGDLDCYRFSAKRGQRIILECWAERIDSKLKPVLEVYDERGRRLAVNRGYYGIDPLIDFHVPADGDYTVKLFDRVYSGSASHFYRLDIDTGPRIAFAVPSVIQAGKTSRVALFGWNLRPSVAERVADGGRQLSTGATPIDAADEAKTGTDSSARSDLQGSGQNIFDRIDVDITPPEGVDADLTSLRLRSAQVTADGFAYHHPGSHAPHLIGLTDIPVVVEPAENHSPSSAQQVAFPCEISGQLTAGNERDWYAIDVERGEVLWLEAFGDRINAPVDLDVSILDSTGPRRGGETGSAGRELAGFSDEVQNLGRTRFPSNHLDPAGRWVAPRDGRYFIVVRNLIGGLDRDPRRIYRLAIRRETPDVHLVVVPARDEPAAFNVSRGGRVLADLFAFRQRGATGSIRVQAVGLPDGVECPDVWLGPGVDHAPLAISANHNAPDFTGSIRLEGHLENAVVRAVRSGNVIRTGTPNGHSRLTADIPVAVRGNSPVRIIADGHETRDHHLYGELTVRHSPGSILDVAVHVERDDAGFAAPVELIGLGLPPLIENRTATIPEGKSKGYVSFYLPPMLPVGTYSIAVQGTTLLPVPSKGNGPQTKPTTIVSNPVTFEVQPAAFTVAIDPNAPKTIKRGEIAKVSYTVKRINGFIGKIHTELWAPDQVIGLRARGSTSVGQNEEGTLQLIANEDAPLGKQPFLRFYAVGVVEDEAVYHGSSLLDLEIVE